MKAILELVEPLHACRRAPIIASVFLRAMKSYTQYKKIIQDKREIMRAIAPTHTVD